MSAPQTNGLPGPSPQPNQQQQPRQHPTPTPSASAQRPRDARLLELLLTSQGVTSYESRVPLLLMDFAYRHTSSVLSDAIHLSVDPYTTHAGAKPSGTQGATASLVGPDPSVSANAVRLAIASRQGYQFRGGAGGAGAGGLSKEWLQELAKERNKVALPRVAPNEWAARLPGERFVLSGLSWGLRDNWVGEDGDEEEEDEEMEDVNLTGGAGAGMDGIQAPELEDVGGDGVEGGTMEDIFGGDVDEEMDQATA